MWSDEVVKKKKLSLNQVPRGFQLISFQVGEAGCEGFAWCTVTKGREDMVMSRDK